MKMWGGDKKGVGRLTKVLQKGIASALQTGVWSIRINRQLRPDKPSRIPGNT